MAKQVQGYLEQHNLKDCAVIGHSLGGKVAMALANNDTQQRISKLVIVDIAHLAYTRLTIKKYWKP